MKLPITFSTIHRAATGPRALNIKTDFRTHFDAALGADIFVPAVHTINTLQVGGGNNTLFAKTPWTFVFFD
jgi:hypothetical protein